MYKDWIIRNEVVLGRIKIIIEHLCQKSPGDWCFMKVWWEHYNLPPHEWVYKLAKIKYLNKYWYLFKLSLNTDCSTAEINEKSLIHVSRLDTDDTYSDSFKDDLINKLSHENFFLKFKENAGNWKQIKIKLI